MKILKSQGTNSIMARLVLLAFLLVVGGALAAYARPGILKRVEPKRAVANILWRLALRTVRRRPLTEGVDVVVQPAGEGKGTGVFAARFIANGEMIGRYEGIMRSNRTYQWAHAAGLTSGAYAFQLSSGSWVDGEDASRSSWARYINHAYGKGANVAPYGRGRPFIYFESIRDIEEGEVRLCTLGLKPFSSTVCALPDTEYQRSRPLRDRSCSSTTATPMSTRLPVFLAG